MAENPNVISAKTRAPQPTQGAPVAATSIVVPICGLQASVKLLDLAPGLYAVSIQPSTVPQVDLGGMALPTTLISPLDNESKNAAEIFGAGRGGNWVGPGGGTVVLRIPAGGGRSLITTYRSEQQQAVPLSIQIAALGRSAPPPATAHESNGTAREPAPASSVQPTLPAELTVCSGQASEQAASGSWAGTPGSKRFLEAFGITPQGGIQPDGIEYKGFGPNGRETPWVSAGKLCGSRGKKVTLTGFAIRPAEHLRDKIDIVYEGAFARSGLSGPRRNGEPCRGSPADDPLEALSVRITSRS